MHDVELEALLNKSSGHGMHAVVLVDILIVPGTHVSQNVRLILEVDRYVGQF
jgi:hypothetical protein